jgi:pyruvate ferredoxin oxidoreductase beta subunit
MATRLRERAAREERLAPGQRLCAGCGEAIIVRQILNAIDHPVVVGAATGCLEIATSVFPYTSWRVPWIHNAFENVSTTLAGAEAACRSLVRQGRIQDRGIKFVAFGGDGATYDIGLQWISGVFERGSRLLYVCLNNEAYMNTGVQRSGATPRFAITTTTPLGAVIPGKLEWRKPITDIMAAHRIPYVAQASPSHWKDLMEKTARAVEVDGPAFLNVLVPCNRGWRHATESAIELSRLGVESCYWPLYEIDRGVCRLSYRPRQKRPVAEFLKPQGRFRHLFQPAYKEMLDEIQEQIDREWESLLERCE